MSLRKVINYKNMVEQIEEKGVEDIWAQIYFPAFALNLKNIPLNGMIIKVIF